MRKMTFFACAALLASTFAFTGCKNDEVEGNYNGETVKTEFSIALPNQLASGKRNMPSATVQRDGVSQFQGIQGITLVPFAKQTSANDKITGSETRLGTNISLSPNIAAADITSQNTKVYSSVSIPLSTGSFLFYGVSSASGTDFQVGKLTAANLSADNPSSFTFSLSPIVANRATLTANGSNGEALLNYLTSIACASDGDATSPKLWYEYTDAMNAAVKAMFDEFVTMKGLSSFEVERVLTDLYKSLLPLNAPIANGIKTAIANNTYATINASDSVKLIAALADFPGEFNLPDGCVNIAWNGSTHEFQVGNYSGMALPDTYTYPAQLWYYANSAIKTSNTSKQTMYDNTNDWATILAAHTDPVSVNSKTRAVAIVDPIQYAVARFDVQVRVKPAEGTATGLEDNSATVEGARKDVNCSAGFPVTAVFIGGQKNVGFDFTPLSGDQTEWTIYDNAMTSSTMLAPQSADTYSAWNHTLVLENGTADVMVAVEMINTAVDFYGAGGQLIPKNGKFYVIAKLTAADATETDGHVFKQDFTTKAKLALKDLKSAYNTIPDLRTPQLELGFSVDLTWQNGHEYVVDFN